MFPSDYKKLRNQIRKLLAPQDPVPTIKGLMEIDKDMWNIIRTKSYIINYYKGSSGNIEHGGSAKQVKDDGIISSIK